MHPLGLRSTQVVVTHAEWPLVIAYDVDSKQSQQHSLKDVPPIVDCLGQGLWEWTYAGSQSQSILGWTRTGPKLYYVVLGSDVFEKGKLMYSARQHRKI